MDYDKLVDDLRVACAGNQYNIMGVADLAIETLRAENIEMQTQLNEFSEFLCRMTGGLLSKTNYTAQAMISAAEDYQQRVCDNDCGLRADLARVTAERDAAQALLAERSGVTGSAPLTTAFGVPLDRLRELVEADRAGKCVILPDSYYRDERAALKAREQDG